MKFWEALKEMEAGAVCATEGDCRLFAVRGGRFGCAAEVGVVPTYLDVDQLSKKNWRIVTPAPSEAKPEPHVDDCKSDTLGYLKCSPYPKPFDTRLWGSVSGEVQNAPSEDVSLRMRTAKLENDVCELSANRDALSDRVEAVEKFCAANADSHQGVLERVEQVERDIRDLSTDARCRIKECSEHDKRLSALEAKLAAQEDAQTNLMAPAQRSERPAPVAWPKGSLPWACAKAMESWTPKGGGNYFPRVRQRSHPTVLWRVEGIEKSGIRFDLFLELDWEPCE